ncbi:peroxiredoxin family protein [Shewanella woodyi]|uniref:Thioredoxin domain-containing protein n=1 Tax=Shewanella woodyi (strain ATCC 51908 / MS32) TaxID=392500 RepID=B1KKE9_SHEWM|nr:redoxin domain-containing protein [Shewanella woodyi]ACA85789.1 conserved hypothetical protein [Shewanella woodyi ATCC 51908]
MTHYQRAPELHVSEWLNTPEPITLAQLKGEVVVLHAFQMLCPTCVSHGLPQAQALHKLFADEKVNILGLHTVFEHHQVMDKAALKVFISEYRLSFPIGIDTPSTQGVIPKTMQEYMLRGTPSIIVIDKQGQIRLSHFGHIPDLALGKIVGQLVAEPFETDKHTSPSKDTDIFKPQEERAEKGCDQTGCSI